MWAWRLGVQIPLFTLIRPNLLLYDNKKSINPKIFIGKQNYINSLYYSGKKLSNLLNKHRYRNLIFTPQLVYIYLQSIKNAYTNYALKNNHNKTFKYFNAKPVCLQKPHKTLPQNPTTLYNLADVGTYDHLNKKNSDHKLLTNFTLYMQINYTSNLLTVRTHTSATKHYLHYSKQGLVITNVHKLFQKWKSTYHLLLNLFFYKIQILTFGTTFFKTEVESLNWTTSLKIKFI